YDVIAGLLQGNTAGHVLLGVLVVKAVIWSVSLGSGTSGGVLAPLLMMGAALGGVESSFLPVEGAGFRPLVSLGAILGGTMRSPLTGIVFALELTHDINMLLPLVVAVTIAHGFTVLVLRRSILAEKMARRGFHLGEERNLRLVVYRMAESGLTRFPVVSRHGHQLVGMIALTDLLKGRALTLDGEQRRERVLGTRIWLPFRSRPVQ
ncbi:MAG: chloride channel protein, partial [Acidobacteriota bacterium]